MKKELPVNIPPMKCWQFSAYPLAIIMNEESSWDWIFSNFIQVSAHENFITHPVPFGFYEFDYAYNPWLSVRRLSRDIFPIFRTNIVDFVTGSLDRDYYVYLNLDEYYVPNRPPYGKTNRSHDVLVHGYDAEQETFSLLGYDERLIFRKTTIPFTAFEKAYGNLERIPNTCNQIYLYQLKRDGSYSLNISLIVEGLEDYLFARDTARKYSLLAEPEHDFVFGVDTYRILDEYLKHLARSPDNYIDIRYMHLLWEHKHCMAKRVQYLTERGLLPHGAALSGRFRDIERLSELARNNLIKYYRSRHPDSLRTVSDLLVKIRDTERQPLEELLGSLSSAKQIFNK